MIEGLSGGPLSNSQNPNLGQLNKPDVSATKVLFAGSFDTTGQLVVLTAPEKKTLVVTNFWAYSGDAANAIDVVMYYSIPDYNGSGGTRVVPFYGFTIDPTAPPKKEQGWHKWAAKVVDPGCSILIQPSMAATLSMTLEGTELQQT